MKTLVGFHAVTSRLRQKPDTISEVYVDATRADHRAKDLRKMAEAAGVRVIPVDAKRLDGMAGGTRHQGVVAQAQPLDMPQFIEDVLEAITEPPLLLLLDGVQDPHNLGACLRSAAAAGATAVIFPKDKAVQINATVRKTSAGAADSIPVIPATNLSRTLRDLQQMGVWIYGLAGEAQASFYSVDLRGNVALVLGGEGDGLRRLTRENCDQLVTIPMPGGDSAAGVESLNVSVAAGVTLFEAVRQRTGA